MKLVDIIPVGVVIGALVVIFGNMALGWLIILKVLMLPAWAFVFDYWFGTSTTCRFNWHTTGKNPVEIRNGVMVSECSKCGRSLRKVNRFWV